MLYAILCYNNEDEVWSWAKHEEEAVMARLGKVRDKIARAGKLGPSARLLPTTAATTLRKSLSKSLGEALVIDGPFAETKEQLLGFYVVDCADLEEALGIARDLSEANPSSTYEIRPLALYQPGSLPA
jgi:hypothetical protein